MPHSLLYLENDENEPIAGLLFADLGNTLDVFRNTYLAAAATAYDVRSVEVGNKFLMSHLSVFGVPKQPVGPAYNGGFGYVVPDNRLSEVMDTPLLRYDKRRLSAVLGASSVAFKFNPAGPRMDISYYHQARLNRHLPELLKVCDVVVCAQKNMNGKKSKDTNFVDCPVDSPEAETFTHFLRLRPGIALESDLNSMLRCYNADAFGDDFKTREEAEAFIEKLCNEHLCTTR